MKNKFFKIAGILIAAIALTLNVHNATTGYGIKGNKNLNPEILADGSTMETFETYIPGQTKEDDNVYTYKETNFECFVYVGGAYAKGKSIVCYFGSDHPVCSECAL